MTSAFHRFGWGILFVLLDIRIQFFDVLPDVIGYALMWNAIHNLGHQRSEYSKAWPFAAILTFLAIPEQLWMTQQNVSSPARDSIPQLAFISLMLLLMMCLMYLFFTALSRHASDTNANEFASQTDSRLALLMIASASTLILIPFALNTESSFWTIWNLTASLFSILALLLLFGTCRHAPSKIQSEARDTANPPTDGNL